MVDFLTGYVLGGRASTRASAREAGATASAAGDIADLYERIDRLLLVVDALWSMLQERGYTDEDLAERIRAIDQQDGSVDGTRKPRPKPCQQCGSMVEPGRRTCAFCGAEVTQGTASDPI